MARPLDPADLDYAIELYLAGQTLQEIATQSGVSISRFHRERIARGIPPRKTKNLPIDKIVASYKAGSGVRAIAREYGVSGPVIEKRLRDAGVPRRSFSEAGLVRAAQMSPDERKAQAAAANRASRLRRQPMTDKLRRALALEQKGAFGSPSEEALAAMLAACGQQVTPQRAIGPYNVDLAMPPVAVEVLGGGWHSIKSAHAERTPYILDEGWHLVMVWDHKGGSALGAGAANYIASFVDEMRRNPPGGCQYRVIAGNGQLLAALGREDNKFPLEPPPRSRV